MQRAFILFNQWNKSYDAICLSHTETSICRLNWSECYEMGCGKATKYIGEKLRRSRWLRFPGYNKTLRGCISEHEDSDWNVLRWCADKATKYIGKTLRWSSSFSLEKRMRPAHPITSTAQTFETIPSFLKCLKTAGGIGLYKFQWNRKSDAKLKLLKYFSKLTFNLLLLNVSSFILMIKKDNTLLMLMMRRDCV